MDPSHFHPDDLIEHREALGRMARALVGDRTRAEDLVQSTFLTALESPPRGGHSLRAWLRRVLSSRATDAQRSRAARRSAERAVSDGWAGQRNQADQQLELAHELVDAVRELGEAYRTVITLRYFEGLPPRAIALRLGLPPSTVKTRLVRGLQKLRERIARPGDGEGRELRVVLAPLAWPVHPPATAGAIINWGQLFMWKKLALIAAALVAFLGTWHIAGRSIGRSSDGIARSLEAVDKHRTELVHQSQTARDAQSEGREVGPAGDSAPAPVRGTLVVRALWSDGSRAAGLRVCVTPVSDPLVGRSTIACVTDASGIARVEGLFAGAVVLESDRSPRGRAGVLRAEVVAGADSEVVFRQELGVVVEGTVVDGDGRPISGAAVWLANWHRDWRGGRLVAVSDAGGRFVLRDVCATQSLGATAAGYEPSDLVDLELVAMSESPRRVRLELLAGGAALSGRVLSSEGEAIQGARVAVGSNLAFDPTRVDGTSVERWAPRIATTDATGGFEFHGLAQGSQPLSILAAGFAEWRSVIDLVPASREFLEVDLQRGIRVHGVVRDEAGVPVAGAVVLVLDKPFQHPEPTRGPYDTGASFHCPAVRSDEQGRFELPPVAPGQLHLYASKGARFGGDTPLRTWTSPIFGGATQETLNVPALGRFEWNPVLRVGAVIHGRAAYADGTPMVWVVVTALDEKTGERFMDHRTGADGSFSIPGLNVGAFTVTARDSSAPADAEPLQQKGVWPSESAIELVATWSPSRELPGSVQGRWLDKAQRLSVATSPVFLLENEGLTAWEHANLDGNAFHFSDVAPGRYRVRVLQADDPIQAWDWFELEPGEDLDLGTLETAAGGSLHIHFERTEAARKSSFEVHVIAPERYYPLRRAVASDGSELVVGALAPGPYQVRLYGAQLSTQPLDIEIRADEVLEVRKLVETGAACSLEVSGAGDKAWGQVTLEVRRGEELFDSMTGSASELRWPFTHHARLPVGMYVARAATESGLSARRTFTISSDLDSQAEIRLELRRR
ncbi:MAG: sigma-70 family RNA polymerase sigma factor [bacterium]|nr:sigma-70 family RNA polymerase sigma factor [bacterium]